MRSLWKGAVSFGLVSIPVQMYTATERQDIRFNYLHRECHTPIRYQKTCPTCKKEVPPEEIVRGYEYERGRYVIISEQDFDSISPEAVKSIDIVDFVDLAQIDPIYFDKTYYLEPSEIGVKPYRLLRQALLDTKKIAVARVMIRSKQLLAVVRVLDQVLAMETIFYPAEIRSHSELQLGENVEVNSKELAMAVDLVNSLASEFEPGKFTDEYRTALLALIDRKLQGQETVTAPKQPLPDGKVVDLMEALEASLQAAKKQQKPTSKTTSRSRRKKA